MDPAGAERDRSRGPGEPERSITRVGDLRPDICDYKRPEAPDHPCGLRRRDECHDGDAAGENARTGDASSSGPDIRRSVEVDHARDGLNGYMCGGALVARWDHHGRRSDLRHQSALLRMDDPTSPRAVDLPRSPGCRSSGGGRSRDLSGLAVAEDVCGRSLEGGVKGVWWVDPCRRTECGWPG